MTLIGFSTGAVALGDFKRALELLSQTSMTAVELSALRLPELPGLMVALPRLDLTKFDYVSFHAPSRFSAAEEDNVVELLRNVPNTMKIIVHPDTVHDSSKWEPFGAQVAIENMDRRKVFGRSAEELRHWFDLLPEARLCLDLAHAHQFDRTMTEAYRILRSFKDRVCQLHVSELDSTGHHFPLSFGSMRAFSEVKAMIPESTPIILESLSPHLGGDADLLVPWLELEAQRASMALRHDEETVSQDSPPHKSSVVNTAATA
jgi:sugar phosphate isomerase/epimerase